MHTAPVLHRIKEEAYSRAAKPVCVNDRIGNVSSTSQLYAELIVCILVHFAARVKTRWSNHINVFKLKVM